MSSTTSVERGKPRALIAHVVHQFGLGGMEHGLATLINRTPPERYRHAIVSLTSDTTLAERIRVPGVPVISLRKAPGRDLACYGRLWKALRSLRPAIVHTRNLGTIDCQAVAAAAGVPARVHGEHGRDTYDIDGSNPKYRLLRRGLKPVIHQYTAVSRDLAEWLVSGIGVKRDRVTHICNGVDTVRFSPAEEAARAVLPAGFAGAGSFVVGTVGRMAAVKDHATLVRAFLAVTGESREARELMRLVIIGDGPERARCLEMLRAAGAENLAWLPGKREDIPALMRAFDVFTLPSIGEGISNTVLEAMATGLPVIATRVGGNGELVDDGETGVLTPAADPAALAAALTGHFRDRKLAARQGQNGRRKVENGFSIERMVEGYLSVYDRLPATRGQLHNHPVPEISPGGKDQTSSVLP